MKEKKKILKAVVLAVFITGIMIGASVMFTLPNPIEKKEVVPEEKAWRPVADNNPGAGAGGFLRIVVKQLNWTGASAPWLNSNASLAVNLSDISADAFNENIPHTVKFGIYVVARFNATQAYCAGNSTWVQAWTRCRITSADLNIAADTVMNKTTFGYAGTTYLYMCFCIEINASAKPLMLFRDQTANLQNIRLEAYY